ncbi:hypothetical protein [Pseudomonas sp. lyk4-TYG-107]|uniref:hypothetical protein n=1 Tax=Pseudomonas sp. lyk4-TYG-107 TaxID=3040317 RepID=UPI0025567A1D|nr:hypothetical protein [Pseudomonas sp. lyk4-TYG-107]
MERFSLKVFPFLALIIVGGILYPYHQHFGFLSGDKADWGAFGDFFGGVLNPLFALFAFFALLHSIRIQMKQIEQLSVDKQAEEILTVIKDIDERLSQLMTSSVGKVFGEPPFIHHMIAEAGRGGGALNSSDAYAEFVLIARQEGSMVEATVREIRSCVITMYAFTLRYPRNDGDRYAPIIHYYILKTKRVVAMLRDVGNLPESVSSFYSSSRAA